MGTRTNYSEYVLGAFLCSAGHLLPSYRDTKRGDAPSIYSQGGTMRVPLKIDSLHTDLPLLSKVLDTCGMHFIRPTDMGVMVSVGTTASTRTELLLHWDDELMLTCAQLIKAGFETGEFEFCDHCGKLQVECDKERAAIADYNSY